MIKETGESVGTVAALRERIRELEAAYAIRTDEVSGFMLMEEGTRNRIRDLESLLIRCGRHPEDCSFTVDMPCTCGLHVFLTERTSSAEQT